MPTCIYCSETKDASLFNREHVVPEAFGTFENNFVLNDRVCHDCNQYFGDHLEIQLGRDSLEGLQRYEFDLKRPEKRTAFGRRQLLTARVAGGFYDGARVWWGPSDDESELVLYAFPQIGFCNSERRCWFPLDEIPSREELHKLGFKPGEALDLRTIEVDTETVQGALTRALEAKGYPSSLEVVQPPMERKSIPIDIVGKIDRTLQRAVAKIAFNYLTFHFERIARMEQFLDIRRYIRFNAVLARNPVSLNKASRVQVQGAPPGTAPVAHAVTVDWETGKIVARVTLFFQFHYEVALASGGFVIAPEFVHKGHIFDPVNRRIHELTPSRAPA